MAAHKKTGHFGRARKAVISQLRTGGGSAAHKKTGHLSRARKAVILQFRSPWARVALVTGIVSLALPAALVLPQQASALGPNAIVPGFNSSTFGPNDDGTYPCTGPESGVPDDSTCPNGPTPVPLGFTLGFFGTSYSSVYINNNGNLTFGTPLSTFTPAGLTTEQGTSIIAPFWADVDTWVGNDVSFGTGTVNGHQAFGVNWPGVGCYSENDTPLDYFQVLLIDRSDIAPGDFDIEYNYDQIQWDSGQASGGDANCLNGTSAHVGYSAGTGAPGTYFELNGSGVDGAFLDSGPASTSLIQISFGTTQLGRYILPVRSGLGVESSGPTPAEQGGAPNGSENPITCSSGQPVNCATGTFWHTFDDLTVPGRGVAINLNRTYTSSAADTDGPFGFGWTDNYGMSLATDSSGVVTITQEDASTVQFLPNGGGTYLAASRVLATLVQNADGTFTFTRNKDQIRYTFSSAGQLLRETDLNGYVTTLSYSGGNLNSVTDPAGRSITFNYTGSHISQVTDPLGRTETFQYDANGNLIKATDRLGRSWSFTYDPNHLLLTMTVPNGGVTTNTYDSSGQVVSQTNAVGQATTWAYSGDPSSAAGGTTTITDPHGSVTTENYTNLELTSVTTAAGTAAAATTSYTYDPATLGIASVTDPDGHVTTYTYDAEGNKLSTTEPLGNVTTYTYNGLNEVTSTKTPLGETTNYSYDANGNLLSITDPLGGVYTLAYGDSSHPGDLTSVSDPDGRITGLTYDSQGDEASVTVSPSSSVHDTTKYVYDLDGERTCIDPANSVAAGKSCPSAISAPVAGLITQTYDSDGELLAATNADGDTSSYSYDNDGNVTSETDPGGNMTKTTYDLLDRPLNVTTGANGTAPSTTTDNYDIVPGSGPCASGITVATYCDVSENASGGPTTSYYNASNEVIQETRPGGQSDTLTYDAAGNKTSLTDAAGRTTSYTYDADNRVTAIDYSDGTTPNVTYTYDADGHRTAMTDGTGNTTYAYDADGRLSSSTDGAGATVSYTYDGAGNILTITYPDTRQVAHTYDGAGRLASISDGGGKTTNFTYDPDGNLTSTAYPNGDTVDSTYDAADQLSGTSVGASSNSSDQLASIAYTRNAAGQITQETDGGALSGPTSFAYNASNQLSSVNGSNYTYDAIGDLTGLPSDVTQAFNAAQELTAQTTPTGTTSYTYDSIGDRTSSSGSGDPTEYAYNQAGELTTLAATAPPAITSAASDTVPAGSAFTFNVTTTGTPSPAISLASGSTLPSGVTLTDNGNGTATLAGTSLVAAAVYTFTIQAANGVSPNATQAFTLTVTGSMAPKPTRLSTTLSAPGTFGGGRMLWWSGRPLLVFSGTSVRDTATLRGVKAPAAEGTVTYTIYGWVGPHRQPSSDWKAVASGGTVKVRDGSVPRSHPVSLPVGYYEWQATYSGDGLNAPSASPFGSESEIVIPVPRCPGGWELGPNGVCRVSPLHHTPSKTQPQASADVSNGALATSTSNSDASATQDPATYTYNGDGLRMTKTSGATTEKFVWDTNESTPQLLADGGADYIYGPTGLPIEQVGSGDAVDYYFHDAIGSTRALLTSSGSIGATFTYGAYGSTTSNTGSATTPFQFAGGYRDSESGLYYLINRYYDPSTGQFLTVDPALAITQQPYSYAGDDPVNRTDPSGLCSWYNLYCEVEQPVQNWLGSPSKVPNVSKGQALLQVGCDLLSALPGGENFVVCSLPISAPNTQSGPVVYDDVLTAPTTYGNLAFLSACNLQPIPTLEPI